MKATYDDAISALRTLKAAGHDAYLAGGCVRDMLLHCEPNDYDVTTSATPEEVEAAFSYTVPVGASFGVVKAIFGENRELDIATFRTDGTYSDNRRPDNVTYSRSPEEDVKRRDFTINGMLMDEDRNVIDFVGGQADLENRIIRCVGDPAARFGEDSLRMLRALRFATRLKFDIDPDTWEAMYALRHTITSVSKERITDEFTKMFSYGRCDMAYWLLRKSGLWTAMMGSYRGDPADSFKAMFGLAKVEWGAPFILPLAIIMYEMHSSCRDGLTGKLCLTSDQKKELKRLLDHISELSTFMNKPLRDQRRMMFWPDVALAAKGIYCLQQAGVEEYQINDTQTINDVIVRMAEVKMMGFPDALINGNDLIGMGYVQGPILGKMLTKVQDAQLEGHLSREGVGNFLDLHFPAAPRKLPNGKITDGMGPFRLVAQCKKCGRSMSFEIKHNEMGQRMWGTIDHAIGVRTFSGSYHYVECENCSTRRAKTGFVRPTF